MVEARHHVEEVVEVRRDLVVGEVVDPIDWRFRCLHFGCRSKEEECFGALDWVVCSTNCHYSLDLVLLLPLGEVVVRRIHLVEGEEVLDLEVPLRVLDCWVG